MTIHFPFQNTCTLLGVANTLQPFQLLYFLTFPSLRRVLAPLPLPLRSLRSLFLCFSPLSPAIIPAASISKQMKQFPSNFSLPLSLPRSLFLANALSSFRCLVPRSMDLPQVICYHDRITLSLRVTPVPAVPNDTCRGRILTTTRPADMITYL